MDYWFSLSYGVGPKPGQVVWFQLDLTESEVSYIKDYLHKHGRECGYEGIEFDNPSLFDKINDSANYAVLSSINEDREEEGESTIDFDDVDWAYMSFDFYWPEELSPEQE